MLRKLIDTKKYETEIGKRCLELEAENKLLKEQIVKETQLAAKLQIENITL